MPTTSQLQGIPTPAPQVAGPSTSPAQPAPQVAGPSTSTTQPALQATGPSHVSTDTPAASGPIVVQSQVPPTITTLATTRPFLSRHEPSNVTEALDISDWVTAMQEELKNKTIIDLKWIFKNKKDEHGIVTKNKARLVAKGFKQQAGIDYD
ncbi:hypothetical protein OSB04_019176 [Centaurea solstitialis]|uniref:Reverse transcriptase Ty1/copia-type domain-containing protein n=1 Tax=Centaurea solstitialis TaxID=347529 RepID=A0AA38SXE6_9ASTR|nr:hypothetical protein OSB04_019176 [Centaurea solstitialis]